MSDLLSSQHTLDLFGSTALSPSELAPVGLIRIPMKEDPVTEPDDSSDSPTTTSSTRATGNPANAPSFRLNGVRGLATGWKNRALDNVAAIRLAQAIEAEDRPATAEEQAALIKFCAFSSTDLAQNIFRRAGRAFNDGWSDLGETLESLVSQTELAGLARATQYAHFTPEYLVRALWRTVQGFGFAGGRVLEPGCGTGLFIALEPADLAGSCRYTGIEADPITAKITRLLYPDSTIRREDFTKAKLTISYDLAIGNPPFSDRTVRVPELPGKATLSLHDAFIARSLAHLRPGGLAAFVVSRWTMDKLDSSARRQFQTHADMVGAIRLPAGAMRADAGTDVVVDLLFFQAREPDTAPAGIDFIETAEVLPALDDNTPAVSINTHFINHPAMVLGTHTRTTSQFGPIYTCAGPAGSALETALDATIAQLPTAIHTPLPSAARDTDQPDDLTRSGHLREGSYFVKSNRLHQITGGHAVEISVKRGKGEGIPKQHAQIIDTMIPVRDAVRAILQAQETNQPYRDAQIRLRRAYGNFVRSYGPINRTQAITITDEDTGETRETVRRPNLSVFADDPDVWLVSSIEEYDPETGSATRGPIFDKRVILPPAEPVVITAADALSVCLHERGTPDLAHMAELLGRSEDDVRQELGSLVFLNPTSNAWETADAYLAGRVREKLVAAEEAARNDPRFERNIAALRDAQPVDLKPSEISARLGAPWIPTDVITLFISEVLGIDTAVRHTPEIALWTLNQAPFIGAADSRTTWGTGRRHAGELMDDALNSRIPQVWDIWMEDGTERRQLNAEETEAAKEKLGAIKTAFHNWIWNDADRAQRLADIYNTQFNNLVPRHFDGSHLSLPGASSVINFYPHQKRAIWRIISAGATYIAHAVGAGKTFSMAAAIMEQKRLGLLTKAMMVVPGHCLAQASREFLQLYPTAKILVADETNFAKAKRQRFISRAATGDWDCIIITHSAFRFIPVSPAFESGMIQQEIDALADLLDNLETDDRIARKRIERIKEGFEEKLNALSSSKDDLVTISEMGIDQLIVDEAQEFRKLTFPTNMGTLKGVDPNGSQRAWDLYVKTRFIETINPERALVMASGTPITNTMGELFTLQRFFAADLLHARQIHSFDAWAANFGECRTELELQPSGLYKPVTRFSEFVNVPELIDIFRHFADVVQKADLRNNLKLPAIATGKRQMITAEPTAAFRAYQRYLDQRIKAIQERRGKPEKGDDILLSVITDGRHSAIDLRLVAPSFPNDPRSKLNMLIDNVERIYHRSADYVFNGPDGEPMPIPGAAQMIFSDLGTLGAESKRGFSAYRWIKTELVRRGIPADEIAFMQHYKKASQKQQLFADVNAGRIRILLGSTATMGTGVNAQKRLLALHHLDVPWLPSDIEQREGRIERQGNQNDEIEVYAYATLTSMDATMWQSNERKQRFIEAALSGDRSIRRLEDAGAQSNQFALAKAIASGDQRLMQKAGLEAEIARLERLRAAHIDNVLMVRRTISNAQATITRTTNDLQRLDLDLQQRINTRGDAFTMTIGADRYTERKLAGQALLRLIAEQAWQDDTSEAGQIGGFAISVLTMRDLRQRPVETFIRIHRNGYTQRIEVPSEPSPLGLVARLESAIDRIDTERADLEDERASAERRLADYSNRTDQPFEFAGELTAKHAELEALEQELSAASDETADQVAPDAHQILETEYGVIVPFPGKGAATSDDEPTEDTDAAMEAA